MNDDGGGSSRFKFSVCSVHSVFQFFTPNLLPASFRRPRRARHGLSVPHFSVDGIRSVPSVNSVGHCGGDVLGDRLQFSAFHLLRFIRGAWSPGLPPPATDFEMISQANYRFLVDGGGGSAEGFSGAKFSVNSVGHCGGDVLGVRGQAFSVSPFAVHWRCLVSGVTVLGYRF